MSPLRRVLPLVLVGVFAIGANAASDPTLRVSPTTVHRGDRVSLSGTHWGAKKVVTLLVGRPNSEATSLIDRVRTNSAGSFSGTVPVKKSAAPGHYVILACRKSCAIKRSRKITILP